MTTAPQTRAPSTEPAGTEPRTPARAGADGGDFCRIAVAGPSSRVDLAVPLGVPLARLLPSLLQHAGEEPGPDGGALHGGWALRTSDGTRLDASRTLGAQQVREGHLLFLTHGTEEQPPPLYDDVVEVIGAESVRTPWPAAATRRTAGAFAAVAVLGAAAALAVAPGVLAGYLGLVTGLLGLGLAGLLSRAFADLSAGTFAAVLSAVPGAVGAMRLLGGAEPLWPGQPDAPHLLLGCAVVAVFGAAGPLLVGGGDGTFAALVVASTFAAVGAFIAVVWDAGAAPAAAVAAPLALAAVPLLPALALRLAHIPGPQLATDAGGLEELPEQIGHRELRARVDRARRLLTGMLAGCQLVVLAGALTLLAAGGLWAGVLAGALWVLALLRARLFREAPQTAVSLATGLAVLLGAAVLLVADFAGEVLPLLAVSVPVCLAVALVACAVGLYSGRRALNPRFARLLDAVETTLLLSVVPLVLAVWGVYTALLELKA
ncbi:type VII secretion integral membrane protein EccD [Streptomyces xiaopingdaonensis]|uniref:type VII secretion integral membrane protein EccD n=1 Tax=Streptomyces xiaopingdaonensis TaxID=1565415 RepID=UPI0003610192|nr:type VII secretion integral membrane protein EccD [Streptomyces xiaopingdaonensis]